MAINNDNGVDQHTVLPAYHVPLPSTESKSQENKVVEDDTVDVVYKEQEQSESDDREPGRLENKAADVKGKIEQFLSWRYMRAPVLIFTACLIFGWWIAGLFTMRHRWIVQTVWAWFLIGVIFFRFVPSSKFGRPLGKVWARYVSSNFFKIPRPARLTLGWLCVLGIIFGGAFGFPENEQSDYRDRVVSIFGIFVFQVCLFISSKHHRAIQWHIICIGLFFQQAIGMFVFKTSAGYDLFNWIITLAKDFLEKSQPAAAFFLSDEIVDQNFFLLTTLPAVMFFIAFVQLCYFLGVIQWFLKKFAWFFQRVFTISGCEAISVTATPFVGQAESACLIKPYVKDMTSAELHALLTAGFSTVSGSTMLSYIKLGVDKVHIVTSAIMSIPSAISISNMRMPEVETPLFANTVVVDRGDAEYKEQGNWILAFSNGAKLGIYVAGLILTNILCVLALLYAFDGFLTWIGRSFSIHDPTPLTLELILKYVFYPISWLMGTPSADVLKTANLLGTKVISNEFVAYQQYKDMQDPSSPSYDPFTKRGSTITEFALCSFGNVASVGIQIGVISALAPSKKKDVSRLVISALFCGIISTCQTAAIAGFLS
ncbi:hypothetical protein E3P89_00418 [Wallemia ichthyophaga]|uniref:Solute carrier family 28 member 3 n=1 Tax=Wallemia ichthyophaga TaxID=245174 RepID=A0A4T0HJB8_WALIC|nr:hypothetical protein E3P90_00577 [Wallemia ichthyophaga]TIB17816.1 hypothetical protein E3P93_00434 [Wallemia ichthyophaga]TIB25489.1 hypothetical protein E3P89_00418 [Wallemia ichthyophaga]TIB27025.1 hypothetical protein E3P88_00446 [Wallemia ichthyophaga]TIB34051.1 hypothetical protein E3P84_01885 [Wallemia ichthyophaga]